MRKDTTQASIYQGNDSLFQCLLDYLEYIYRLPNNRFINGFGGNGCCLRNAVTQNSHCMIYCIKMAQVMVTKHLFICSFMNTLIFILCCVIICSCQDSSSFLEQEQVISESDPHYYSSTDVLYDIKLENEEKNGFYFVN